MNDNGGVRVTDITVHDCSSVRIIPDPENGCLDIRCFDSSNNHFRSLRLLVFGPDDNMPGIDLREPEEPEVEEDLYEHPAE